MTSSDRWQEGESAIDYLQRVYDRRGARQLREREWTLRVLAVIWITCGALALGLLALHAGGLL